MPKFIKTFKGVVDGDVYPTEFNAGDECPPELVLGASEQGALNPEDVTKHEAEAEEKAKREAEAEEKAKRKAEAEEKAKREAEAAGKNS